MKKKRPLEVPKCRSVFDVIHADFIQICKLSSAMHEAIQDRSLKTRIFTATSKKEKAKMYCYRPIKMNKLYPSNPDFHRFIVAFK